MHFKRASHRAPPGETHRRRRRCAGRGRRAHACDGCAGRGRRAPRLQVMRLLSLQQQVDALVELSKIREALLLCEANGAAAAHLTDGLRVALGVQLCDTVRALHACAACMCPPGCAASSGWSPRSVSCGACAAERVSVLCNQVITE